MNKNLPDFQMVRTEDLPAPRGKPSYYQDILRRLRPGEGIVLDESDDAEGKRNSSGLHAAARALGINIDTYVAETGQRVIRLLPRKGRPRKSTTPRNDP